MFKKIRNPWLVFLTLTVFLAACSKVPNRIEPLIKAPPHPKEIQKERKVAFCLPENFSISPFPPLTRGECDTDWGKEYRIALMFAEDFDLYRAITGFKRALCLLPEECACRRLELEYQIALSYFLGQKYLETTYTVETTGLIAADATFPAFDDLLLILFECYTQLGKEAHAAHIMGLIQEENPLQAKKLSLLSVVKQADFETLCQQASCAPEYKYLDRIVCGYQKEAKSIRKAQWLNATLPGAGYWYVGQKETAVTAFIINALFIAAASQFFYRGYIAAGAITLSLETGWYFGGITGAGYAAKYYNERLYCSFADKIAQKESYFPIMMLKYSF